MLLNLIGAHSAIQNVFLIIKGNTSQKMKITKNLKSANR